MKAQQFRNKMRIGHNPIKSHKINNNKRVRRITRWKNKVKKNMNKNRSQVNLSKKFQAKQHECAAKNNFKKECEHLMRIIQ